jgi:hypothetical protein
MSDFATDDPRVRKIGQKTWIDTADRHVFEAQDGGINVFNLRKGPGRQPALNEAPYDTLDAAIRPRPAPPTPARTHGQTGPAPKCSPRSR